MKGISYFEFDLPEHLPSSPMCPANPMHKLKGRGVCVVSDTKCHVLEDSTQANTFTIQFHGRAKQVSTDDGSGIVEEDMVDSS